MPPPRSAVEGAWLLETESSGPQWLGPGWFHTRDLDPALIQDQVRLSLDGQPVPHLWVDGPDGPGLFFYAHVVPSRYAPWAAYRLDLGIDSGPAMAPASILSDAPPVGQDAAWSALRREEDLEYRPQIEAPEPWFWESVFSEGRITHTVALTNALIGPVTVTVRLWNQAQAANTPAPRLWWDGEPIGVWDWAGPAEQSWRAGVNGSGDYTLALELPGAEDGTLSRIWLDGWGLTFRRPLSVGSQGVTWTAEEGSAAVVGAEGARLIEVTDPAAPLDGGTVGAGQFPTQPGSRYWLGLPWTAPEPARSRPLTSVDREALGQAEYLIVAPELFWEALQPLVEHRRSEGLSLFFLAPEQVYDAYGDGRPDPEAIRAMVSDLQSQGALRYLFLVGDASARPDGYAGQEGTQRVVTAFVPTAYLHETPSDQALVTDDEGLPLVAVGRFPAQTVDQVEAMVAKTLHWEENGLSSGLVLTDDQSEFALLADEILPQLPVASQRFDAAQDDARDGVLAGLEDPGMWLNYIGHGSLVLWGDEKVMLRDDRWPEPAVVTVWACLSAYFVHPKEDSLAEVWLSAPQGGAVAFVGPTGETFLSQQRPIAMTFYQEIQAGQRIGDALLAGWLAADDFARDAAHSFLLLGDPALRLHSP